MRMKPICILYSLMLGGLVILSCRKNQSPQPDLVDNLQNQIDNHFNTELIPEANLPCSMGAIYRKAVSSIDYWQGIKGTVILPTIHFDSTRVNPNKPGCFLDNPSIYIGGNSDEQETDIGMTWEVIKDQYGNVSTTPQAFRPFLRRTAHGTQASTYINAPAQSDYYWYPGDTVTMRLQLVGDGVLHFKVSGAGKSFESDFSVDGYQYRNKADYKRVNAIDQVANEGKPTQSTKTEVLGAKWLNVYLYRSYKSKVYEVPMHTRRFTDMRCPDTSSFKISSDKSNTSNESIDILGRVN